MRPAAAAVLSLAVLVAAAVGPAGAEPLRQTSPTPVAAAPAMPPPDQAAPVARPEPLQPRVALVPRPRPNRWVWAIWGGLAAALGGALVLLWPRRARR
jgi:hypothetical protein